MLSGYSSNRAGRHLKNIQEARSFDSFKFGELGLNHFFRFGTKNYVIGLIDSIDSLLSVFVFSGKRFMKISQTGCEKNPKKLQSCLLFEDII